VLFAACAGGAWSSPNPPAVTAPLPARNVRLDTIVTTPLSLTSMSNLAGD
jgi:hypothetical protein